MPQTLVLARSISEANQYAKAAGLQRFTYRPVRHAGSIRGVRHAEVHLLSSFLRRPDKYAIMGALRWAQTLTVFYVDFVDGQIVDGTGPTAHDLEVAYRYHALREESLSADNPDTDDHGPEEQSAPTGETEPSEDAAPTEKPKPSKRAAAKRTPPAKPAAPAPPVDDLFG